MSKSCCNEPIACTLGAGELTARIAEFRELFTKLVRTEPIEGGYRWSFRVENGLEEHIRDLARREHECCRFFDFAIRVDGDTIVWEARTEELARPLLDDLVM